MLRSKSVLVLKLKRTLPVFRNDIKSDIIFYLYKHLSWHVLAAGWHTEKALGGIKSKRQSASHFEQNSDMWASLSRTNNMIFLLIYF